MDGSSNSHDAVLWLYSFQYGISGPFWYAAGASIQILLFAIISIHLKIRAPGAKTFLQVIKARFGSATHIVFCVFALMTNLIVTALLMLGKYNHSIATINCCVSAVVLSLFPQLRYLHDGIFMTSYGRWRGSDDEFGEAPESGRSHRHRCFHNRPLHFHRRSWSYVLRFLLQQWHHLHLHVDCPSNSS